MRTPHMCAHVSIYVYMWTHIHVSTCVHICLHVFTCCLHMFTSALGRGSNWCYPQLTTCVNIYMCIHVCTCVYMCLHVSTTHHTTLNVTDNKKKFFSSTTEVTQILTQHLSYMMISRWWVGGWVLGGWVARWVATIHHARTPARTSYRTSAPGPH